MMIIGREKRVAAQNGGGRFRGGSCAGTRYPEISVASEPGAPAGELARRFPLCYGRFGAICVFSGRQGAC